MAKTTYQFILLALVILEVSRQCSSPVEAGPSKFWVFFVDQLDHLEALNLTQFFVASHQLYPSVAVTPPSSISSSPTKTATRTVPAPPAEPVARSSSVVASATATMGTSSSRAWPGTASDRRTVRHRQTAQLELTNLIRRRSDPVDSQKLTNTSKWRTTKKHHYCKYLLQ